jgi:predicted DNA-binding protein
MGVELKDYRGRITPETDCALEALSRTTGQDRQEIVRGILHKWAMEQIHAATVMHRLLQAEGLSGITGGIAGSAGESEGLRGNGRA